MKNNPKNNLLTILNKYNNFIIASHINPDGDSICCQIAMAYVLDKLKKNYKIISEDAIPKKYRFIARDYYSIVIPEFIQIPKSQRLAYQLSSNFKREVLVVFDCGELRRVGDFSKDLSGFKEIINIDHHQDNGNFGTTNYVFNKASSSGEILFKLLKQSNFQIDKNIAELIYIAIATDTGFFCQQNTTRDTHIIASEIIDLINVEKISYILKSKNLPSSKILGRAIDNIAFSKNHKIIYSCLTADDFSKTRARNEDTDGIVEFLRDIDLDTNISILFKEFHDEIKINFRGKNGFNVLKLASKLGGGGHKNAAGANIKGKLKEVIKKVILTAEGFVS